MEFAVGDGHPGPEGDRGSPMVQMATRATSILMTPMGNPKEDQVDNIDANFLRWHERSEKRSASGAESKFHA